MGFLPKIYYSTTFACFSSYPLCLASHSAASFLNFLGFSARTMLFSNFPFKNSLEFSLAFTFGTDWTLPNKGKSFRLEFCSVWNSVLFGFCARLEFSCVWLFHSFGIYPCSFGFLARFGILHT